MDLLVGLAAGMFELPHLVLHVHWHVEDVTLYVQGPFQCSWLMAGVISTATECRPLQMRLVQGT